MVGADFYPFGTQDFGPAFAKVKEAKPDIVWLMVAGADAITAVKQYRSFGMKQPLVFHGWDESFLGRGQRRRSRPESSPARPTTSRSTIR